MVVELPAKAVKTDIVQPAEGSKQWWSGMGDDLKNTLARPVDLTGKSKASLTLKGWWDIEENYDYLYTEVSTDGGATGRRSTAPRTARPSRATAATSPR